jgi:hypothetical protein
VNPGCLASADWRLAQSITVWAMTVVTVLSAVPYAVRAAALLRAISKDGAPPSRSRGHG